MRYLGIEKDNMVNGPGLRIVFWVAGCEWYCPGCHNPESWNKDGGKEVTIGTIKTLEQLLGMDHISGITFSGGDPLALYNREEVSDLIIHLKKSFPDKSFWMYTGYLFENVKHLEVMKYVDVLVDGPFMIDLKTGNSKWRGSDNQRLIMAAQSVKQNELIEYMP